MPSLLLRRRSASPARTRKPGNRNRFRCAPRGRFSGGPSMSTTHTVDVAIVGGGPAGLTAAAALSRDRARNVVVLERESAAGGIPRHSDHPGYGMRPLTT